MSGVGVSVGIGGVAVGMGVAAGGSVGDEVGLAAAPEPGAAPGSVVRLADGAVVLGPGSSLLALVAVAGATAGGVGHGVGVGSLRLQPARPASRASPASKGSTGRRVLTNMARS